MRLVAWCGAGRRPATAHIGSKRLDFTGFPRNPGKTDGVPGPGQDAGRDEATGDLNTNTKKRNLMTKCSAEQGTRCIQRPTALHVHSSRASSCFKLCQGPHVCRLGFKDRCRKPSINGTMDSHVRLCGFQMMSAGYTPGERLSRSSYSSLFISTLVLRADHLSHAGTLRKVP